MHPVSVSIATSFDYTVPLDAQVPLIAEAGFTHVALGANESHSNYLTPDGQRDLRTLAARHDDSVVELLKATAEYTPPTAPPGLASGVRGVQTTRSRSVS